MATELFSMWGFQTGWRSQWGDGYEVTATLDGVHICYWAHNSETVEKMFEQACRRTLFRRFVPWLSPPPIELGDRLREPEPMTYQAEILRAGGTVATIETLHRAMLDARVHGQESSNYFLDKCGAEAGAPETMTVSELIALLRRHSPTAVVVIRDSVNAIGEVTASCLRPDLVQNARLHIRQSSPGRSSPHGKFALNEVGVDACAVEGVVLG